jgi:hypothetical protein
MHDDEKRSKNDTLEDAEAAYIHGPMWTEGGPSLALCRALQSRVEDAMLECVALGIHDHIVVAEGEPTEDGVYFLVSAVERAVFLDPKEMPVLSALLAKPAAAGHALVIYLLNGEAEVFERPLPVRALLGAAKPARAQA